MYCFLAKPLTGMPQAAGKARRVSWVMQEDIWCPMSYTVAPVCTMQVFSFDAVLFEHPKTTLFGGHDGA